jgi:hypothetical protein
MDSAGSMSNEKVLKTMDITRFALLIGVNDVSLNRFPPLKITFTCTALQDSCLTEEYMMHHYKVFIPVSGL